MLGAIFEQLLILLAAVVLLGVPGAALVSLLRVRAVLPDALAVPAGAMLGALVACAATALQLVLETRSLYAILTHALLSIGLVVAAVVRDRRRRDRGDQTVPVARGWDRTTSGIVIASALLAWYARGGIKLDALYHVSVSRKLIELAHPTFGNINRFADGGPNPTYALPGWHAFVGWTAQLTGSDPIISWEIMPVLIVALSILAAAGFARVVLETPRAQPLGAFAWALTRIFFARREVDGDGITFGAVPGQLTFELVFPVLFAAIVVAIWTPAIRVRRSALYVSVAMIAAIVIFHANYIPYVAIVGLGYVAWWLVTGPIAPGIWRRTLIVGGVVAAASALFMGMLLPLLAQLSNFGNAPEEARIDYHLTKTFGMEHITGGHLFDLLGWTGLPLILVMPWVAARWRATRFAIVPGGILAMATVCFVPPLYSLLAATGSLTVGLRINHIFGVLLMPVFAAAMLMFADLWTERLTTRRSRLWVVVGVLVCFIAIGALAGYRKFLPDQPGYLAWLLLVAVWLTRLVRRLRGRALPITSEDGVTAPVTGTWGGRLALMSQPRTVLAVVAVVVVGLAVPIGLTSLDRLHKGVAPIDAGLATGDLTCLGGPVERSLMQLPQKSIVLSDPATSFRAMALAPVYVVGDYKVWNSPTKNNRVVERLAAVNRFFDTSASDAERLQVLRDRDVDYLLLDLDDSRWLEMYQEHAPTKADGILQGARRALDRFADVQSYGGGAVAQLIANHPDIFEQLALDPRGREAAIPPRTREDGIAPCQSFGVWKVDRAAAEQAIALANISTVVDTIDGPATDPIVVPAGTVLRKRISVTVDGSTQAPG